MKAKKCDSCSKDVHRDPCCNKNEIRTLRSAASLVRSSLFEAKRRAKSLGGCIRAVASAHVSCERGG